MHIYVHMHFYTNMRKRQDKSAPTYTETCMTNEELNKRSQGRKVGRRPGPAAIMSGAL